MSIEAYPLQWPEGKSRAKYRQRAKFKTAFSTARDGVYHEVSLLGGKQPVLSSNLMLRQDGLPLAKQRNPDDPGVAVYFTYKDQQMCFACDKWDRVTDNIQAVRLTIEALRGIARWGSGDMMEQAFHGFKTLPPPGGDEAIPPWWVVLDCAEDDPLNLIEQQYLRKRRDAHPDHGGSSEAFHAVINAWEQAKKAS